MIKNKIGIIASIAILVLGSTTVVAKSNEHQLFKPTAENEDCLCDGKLTTLTLRYIGDQTTAIAVVQKNGEVIHTDGRLYPGEVFALTGTDQRGSKESNTTLGPFINIYLRNGTELNIHTSCSVEINVGDVIGDFRVLGGTSRNNGAICGSPPVQE